MPADWIVLRRLLTLLFKDRRPRMAFVLGLMEEGLGMTLGVTSPLLLGRLIERLPAGGAGERIALVLAFAASWFAPSLLGAFKPVHTATIVAGLYHQLIGPILREQLPPLAIIHDRVAGGVTGALERLPFNLQLVLDGLVWRAGPVLLQVLLTLAAIAWTLPLRYAGLLGATLLAYLVLADRGAAHLVARSEASSQAVLSLSGDLGDVVANAERVVCNGALEQELERLDAATERRDTANHRLATAIALATGSQTLLLLTGLSLVLVLAASDVATRRLGAADFVVLQAFALRLALPLSGWAISLRQAGGALADLRRTLALVGLLRPPAMVERPLAGAAADLVLEKVSFAYPGNRSGLSQISLRLDADQMVAIVGANGSGKSTLARLMAGLLTPDQGKVLVGGADLQTLALGSRPARVLYVPQFIGLFHRPLRDNALYPPAQADEAALIGRLSAWRFHSDGASVSLEGDSGERGGALSGGQVQKLELARLCALTTPILILDESTSALDAASEAEIVSVLRGRCSSRLLILVTHKPGLAASADQVIFIAAGRIAGAGRHDALMDNLAYRSLWA